MLCYMQLACISTGKPDSDCCMIPGARQQLQTLTMPHPLVTSMVREGERRGSRKKYSYGQKRQKGRERN